MPSLIVDKVYVMEAEKEQSLQKLANWGSDLRFAGKTRHPCQYPWWKLAVTVKQLSNRREDYQGEYSYHCSVAM